MFPAVRVARMLKLEKSTCSIQELGPLALTLTVHLMHKKQISILADLGAPRGDTKIWTPSVPLDFRFAVDLSSFWARTSPIAGTAAPSNGENKSYMQGGRRLILCECHSVHRNPVEKHQIGLRLWKIAVLAACSSPLLRKAESGDSALDSCVE
jgi:hypothetical protein